MARCMSCERKYDPGRCSLCLADRARAEGAADERRKVFEELNSMLGEAMARGDVDAMATINEAMGRVLPGGAPVPQSSAAQEDT